MESSNAKKRLSRILSSTANNKDGVATEISGSEMGMSRSSNNRLSCARTLTGSSSLALPLSRYEDVVSSWDLIEDVRDVGLNDEPAEVECSVGRKFECLVIYLSAVERSDGLEEIGRAHV